MMATSNFIIDDPETAERFVDALEKSAQDPPLDRKSVV